MNSVAWVARSIDFVACVVVMMVAWAGEVVAQPPASQSPQQNLRSSGLVTAPADSAQSPFVVLTDEDRRVEEVTTAAEDSKPKSVKRNETQSKRQVAVRIRTELVHPSPQLRHATATYQPNYPERTVADDKIYAVLGQPLAEPWEFNDAPLRDVRRTIMHQFRIPCEIDVRALEDLGLDVDTPVNLSLERVSLRSALRHLLGNLDLAFLIKDEVLLITTKEKAEEHLVIGCYPLPTVFDQRELTEVIQLSCAADTWDTVGGPGAIRCLLVTNELVISQTMEVHEQITELLTRFDADLGPAGVAKGAAVALRFYPVRDPRVFTDLQATLAATCNAALGEAADPTARVAAVGGKLVVQSASRPFHVYAAELMRAVNGVEVVRQEIYPEQVGINSGMGMGGLGLGGGFCWVAREVYGNHDPRWIVFRAWLMNEAPAWLRQTYARHGEWFATWLRMHPAAKFALRPLMDAAIGDARLGGAF